MITKENILKHVSAKLAEGTNFIVDVTVKIRKQDFYLVRQCKRPPISDCVEMSKYVESNLDREVEDYELNVSSPGLDQSFKVLMQYVKNIGKQVNVVTKENKKLSGKLISATEDGIVLEVKSTERVEGKKENNY